jgi:putative ATP-dependent endonuclease of the OLD family
MFLEKFNIKRFRAIKDITLTFNKGLNVLIGENNSGKTTIIDALRLCIGYGNLRRELYITTNDFYVEKGSVAEVASEIEFHLYFKIEVPEEAAWYNDMLITNENGNQDVQLHFRYYIDEKSGIKRVKYKFWGGANEGQLISPEVLSLLYYVHLDALRDAEQYLKPIRGNRLGQLFASIQTDTDSERDKEKKIEMAKKVRSAVDSDPDWNAHVAKGKEKINEHLTETSFTDDQQQIDIDFLPFDFNRLVDNLKIQMPVYSDEQLEGDKTRQKHFELSQNGLGYNNLIYSATVLGDIKQRKELEKEGFAALLIEEPEAHLHPQLQNLFFNYLSKLDREQGFQIFVSSHSPTITAKADLKSVIVLQSPSHVISPLSLTKSGLTSENQNYLHKFLDVTKSQLFFSKGVILVEGISEALLMRIFSKKIGEDYDIEKAGIELVNLNGVAFEHFANLFNNDDDAKNLKTRCAIITDDDRDKESDEVSSRAKKASDLAKKNLRVFLAEKTFEFELFIAGNNKEILFSIFNSMHPTAASRISANDDVRVYAENFLDKIISDKAKSELAHRLAVTLSTDEALRTSFVVPTYIQNAIKYVVKGEESV